MTVPVLVSTSWLSEHLQDARVRIIDIRGHVIPASEPLPHYFNHYDDYVKSHIPGAQFIDWVHEITDPADLCHAKIAAPDRFSAVMRRHGIDGETHVIAYDDAGGMFAARLWWALNYYGHDRVSVLDGGWNRWVAEGRPVTDEVARVAPGSFVPKVNPVLYRDADAVAQRRADETLIDVRTPAEYAGQASRAMRKGHIPGAINLPRASLLNQNGDLLGVSELAEQFSVAEGRQPIFYCNGGVSASFGLLAWRAAGNAGGSVYDGSWKDWGNDPDRPIG
jgi:thiosulfate/3-mercaptopyruvate sulfurtransferase